MARIDGWKMQFFSTKGTVCEALWHFGNDVVDFFLMLPGRYSNLNQFLHSKKSCRTIHDVVFFSKGGKISDFFSLLYHLQKSKMRSYHSDLKCPITFYFGNSKMVKNRRLENAIFFNKRHCFQSPLAFWQRCCRLFSDAAWTLFQFKPIFALKE